MQAPHRRSIPFHGMALKVCVAGATGWTGRAVAEAVLEADDLELRSAVSRSAAGRDLGEAWGWRPQRRPRFPAVSEALDGVEILVDYTSHDAVRGNTLAAIERGVSVVIGSSGLSADDFRDIDAAARERRRRRHRRRQLLPHRCDGSGSGPPGRAASSRTARSSTTPRPARRTRPAGPPERLPNVSPRSTQTTLAVPVDQTAGLVEARGATVAGTQVHSVRLPSFVVSTEVVFALPDERLTIRHDAGRPRRHTSLALCSQSVPRRSRPGWSAVSTPCSSISSERPQSDLDR